MADWKNRIIGYGEAEPDQLLANPNNWRIHPKYQQDALLGVLNEVGIVQNIIVNQQTGFVVDGHARIALAMRNGQKTIPVTYVDLTAAEEELIIMTFDPIDAQAATDKVKLEELLNSAKANDKQLEEFIALMREEEIGDFLGVDKKAKPNSRKLPLDLIFTTSNAPLLVMLAKSCGILWGIQSMEGMLKDSWAAPTTLSFIDNNYFKYNHQMHLACIRKFEPKYATVKDIMTEGQCERAKIEYTPLEQILEWAEELSEYAENVILIPKYDVLDKIPEKFMLGYSVPSSHGSTPLPASAFKGRRVHLLGGSWRLQLAHMAELGEDIVSVDNNYEFKVAKYGGYITPDGEARNLKDTIESTINNPMIVALALSLGAMGAKLNDLYAGAAPEDDVAEYEEGTNRVEEE